MTQGKFDRAKKITNEIKDLQKFVRIICGNPGIKSNNTSEHICLSLVDTKDNDLKKIIIDWCNERIEKLQVEFEQL